MNKDNFQAVYNILSQVILNGTNFVLIMLFTKYLDTDSYGIVSIYQAYVTFFSVIVGLNCQGSIGTAFVHLDKKKHANYLASIFLIGVLSLVITLLLCILFMPFIEKFTELSCFLIILMLLHSFGYFAFNFVSIKYVYMRKSQYSCLLSLFVSVLMIVMSVICISKIKNENMQYMGRILSLAIPYILCGCFVAMNILIKGNPFVDIKKAWLFCLPISLPLVLHGISQVVLAQTDKIMLQKIVLSNGTVGVYSFIVTFVHILNSIYIALNNTWVPLYYGYIKNNEFSNINKRTKKYAHLYTCLTVGFILVAPEFVKLFSAKSYWKGIDLIPVIAMSVFAVFLYSFAVNFELYHQKTKWIALGTMTAAAVNIIFNAVLIPVFSYYGAAFATLISYILLWLFHEKCAKRINSDYPYNLKYFLKNIMMVTGVSILFYIFIDYWIIRWLLAIGIGVIMVVPIIKEKSVF